MVFILHQEMPLNANGSADGNAFFLQLHNVFMTDVSSDCIQCLADQMTRMYGKSFTVCS